MKKLKLLMGLAGVLAFLVLVAGCKNSLEDIEKNGTSDSGNGGAVTSQTGSIKGKAVYQEGVTDFSGIDVYLEKLDSKGRSASVTETAEKGRAANIFFASTVTAKDGSYSFSNLADGEYTVYASNGDEAAYVSATVAEGRAVTVEDLQLVLKGSISGTLKVTGGKAEGSIVGIAGTSYIAFVGSDGKFTISGVPAGKHKLCIMTNGKYEALATEYNVVGKTVANAGTISVTVEETAAESGISYVTAKATDRGIEFRGDILNNIHSDNTTNIESFYSTTAASANVSIKDNGNGVEMIQKFIKPYNYSGGWSLTYPLVKKGKEYSFTVKVSYGGYVMYKESFTVTAQGGIGEYKIENADKYGVELTDDRIIQRTGKAAYTDNTNVKVQREGLIYELYRNDGNQNWYWVTSSADFPRWLDTTDGKMDLKNISSEYQPWQSYEGNIEAALSGYDYIVTAYTTLLITGWTYNDSVVFRMNDYAEARGSWGGEKVKKLVTYGIGIVARYDKDGFVMPSEEGSSSEACRSKEAINKFLEDNKLSLSNMPGKEIEIIFGDRLYEHYGESNSYLYANTIEMAENVYEPEQIPVLKFNNDDSKYNLIFRGWRIASWTSEGNGTSNSSFPYKGYWRSGNATYIIDGKTAYSVPLYAVFELIPTAIITAKFKLSEKSDTVYATLVSQPGDGAYGRFDLPKDPVREGYIFKGWYYIDEGTKRSFYGAYSNLFNRDVTIYADWIKEVSIKFMDGSNEIKTVKTYTGTSTSSFNAPTKEGYFFYGWYADADFKSKVNVITEDTTVLYAKYTDKPIPDLAAAGMDASKYTLVQFTGSESQKFQYYLEAGTTYKVEWIDSCADSNKRNMFNGLTDNNIKIEDSKGETIQSIDDGDFTFTVTSSGFYSIFLAARGTESLYKGAFHIYADANLNSTN